MANLNEAFGRLWTADDGADMLHYDGEWVRWGQVRSLAERVDQELRDAGCSVGGRVAVVLGNRPESVASLIAILRGERTLVTISPLQPPERLSNDLIASGVSYVLAPEQLWSESVFTKAVDTLGAAGWGVNGEETVMRAQLTHEAVVGDSAVAVEMLTSGTTGPPKRIPLTRGQLEASLAAASVHNHRADGADKPPFAGAVGLVSIPIVHIGGMWALLQSLVAARRVALLERFTLAGWHDAVKEHKPALVGLPPPAIRAVLDADIPREDLASVRAINAGTSPVDPVLVDAFFERYGIPVVIVYGATEFCGAVAGWTVRDFNERWNIKKGSVGRAFPGVRLRVIDDDGDVLSTGETGRLQVAAVQVSGSEECWVTTSDLAHTDEDGFLYIDGRADDVILRGGFKIAPETVATALCGHEAVADAVVFGLRDERLGQVPVAAVELRPGASATPNELRMHCRSVLAPYEVPTQVYVLDELPRGAALKVDRRGLMERLDQVGD
ncbi:AMP-dependent synthetase [Mycobacterium colombiense]|uniref:class I adenylate-forming enzyme family protein n=1 Tax=Mycobacterium colombiense TaxID=339268 RepID=UPI0007EFF3E8|nr:AMP-binding protein [Mycobacterium colombiense]OBK66268.1 AMP-dependent synthetase [Mycobacterium colombiense]